MLLVSEVEETEIFKICLEYWNHLAAELYRESPFSTSASPLLSGTQHFDVPPRRQLYLPVLSKVMGIFQLVQNSCHMFLKLSMELSIWKSKDLEDGSWKPLFQGVWFLQETESCRR